MGTSSARLAPTSKSWRAAKAAATRYLAPAGEGAVSAGEVVARYRSALTDPEAGPALAAFSLTRKAAQEVGGQAARHMARESDPLTAAAEILARVPGAGGAGLEEAVVRVALVETCDKFPVGRPDAPANENRAPEMTRDFLAAAFYHRLIFDLGEPLEAAALSYNHYQTGCAGIRQEIMQIAGAAGIPASPRDLRDWRGLAGWNWATAVLTGLLVPRK